MDPRLVLFDIAVDGARFCRCGNVDSNGNSGGRRIVQTVFPTGQYLQPELSRGAHRITRASAPTAIIECSVQCPPLRARFGQPRASHSPSPTPRKTLLPSQPACPALTPVSCASTTGRRESAWLPRYEWPPCDLSRFLDASAIMLRSGVRRPGAKGHCPVQESAHPSLFRMLLITLST